MIALRSIVLIGVWAALLPATAAAGPPRETGPFRAPELVEITALEPGIKLDVRYARSDNFAGRPVYKEARAFLQAPAAEALQRAHRALRDKGYGLMVFDGYRPWSVTKTFWDLTPADQKVFVADPAKGSKHNRGCAVDLTLFDLKTGKAVAMPSEYDEPTERAYATYGGGDAAARERRDLLIEAMGQQGFFVYPYEWWHFDYKDWREYPILDLPFEVLARSAGATSPSAAGDLKIAAVAPIDIRRAKLVDLTYPFDATTLYWPTATSGFDLKRLSYGRTEGGYFYSANSFCAPEHGGTHLDAPIHFAEGAWSADEIPLRRLLAEAVVIDVAQKAAANADYRLTPEDLRDWEKRHGRVPEGAIVLLRTGWGARWPDRKRYFGDDTKGDATRLHFPAYGKESAEILVRERRVAVLGVDTASIDYGPSKDFIVHQVAMGANVPALENVAHLEDLPTKGAWVVALPMKIAGGSGGPLRVVALLPDEKEGIGKEQP
jgi:D-alanyl-D-alanine dipeptidase/kynurenine formamidase